MRIAGNGGGTRPANRQRDYGADVARIREQQARAREAAIQRAQAAEAARQAEQRRQAGAVTPDRIAVDPAGVTHLSEDAFLAEADHQTGVGREQLRAIYAERAADGEFSAADFADGLEEATSSNVYVGAPADPEAVEEVQGALRDLGYLQDAEAGVFDAATEAAVLAFQEDNGLLVDGIVGIQTRSQLQLATQVAVPAEAPPAPEGPSPEDVETARQTLNSTAQDLAINGGPYTQETIDRVLDAQVTLEQAGDMEAAEQAGELATALYAASPELLGEAPAPEPLDAETLAQLENPRFRDGDVSHEDRLIAESLLENGLLDRLESLPVEAHVDLIKTLVTREAGDLPKDAWVAALADSLAGHGEEGRAALDGLARSLGDRDGQLIANDSRDFATRFSRWIAPETLGALSAGALGALRDGVDGAEAGARLDDAISERNAEAMAAHPQILE